MTAAVLIGLAWSSACLVGGLMFAVSAWRYHRGTRHTAADVAAATR